MTPRDPAGVEGLTLHPGALALSGSERPPRTSRGATIPSRWRQKSTSPGADKTDSSPARCQSACCVTGQVTVSLTAATPLKMGQRIWTFQDLSEGH